MGLYTSYYLYQKYEQREGQDPIPCTPNVFSVDGQGTMQKVIKLDDDPECGYTPEPTEPIYRWYQMPISEGYVCNECPIVPTGDTKFTATYNNSTTYAVECDSTSGITSGETRPQGYQHSAITSVEIGDCVSRIGEFAFDQCYQLTSVRISSGVTHIAYGAFEYTNITNLYIPDSVTSIGDVSGSALEMNGAFGHNSGLTNVEIGTGITSIAEYSFYDTPSLTSVTIHTATPPTTSEWVFGHDNVNPNLQIHVPCESVNTYKTAQFWKTYAQYITGIGECPEVGHKLDITYTDNTTYSMDCDSTSGVTSAETRSSGKAISNVKSVVIGDCVTSIGARAFSGATSLSSVTIPDSVTTTGSSAFTNCYSVQTALTISDNVTEIGTKAFEGCSGLTSVYLGSKVWYIYNRAFYNCSNLQSITINRVTPPNIYTECFGNTNGCPIYVPAEAVNTYKNKGGNWFAYASRIQAIP